MAKSRELRILIEWSSPDLVFSYSLDGKIISSKLQTTSDCQEKYYILYWLLLASVDIIGDCMHRQAIFGLVNIEKACPEIQIAVDAYIHRLKGTIEGINKFADERHKTLNSKNILWLGAKDIRSMNFISELEKTGKNVFQVAENNYYNQESREFVEANINCLTADEIVEYVVSKEIGIIISINWDYLQLSSTVSNAEVYFLLMSIGVKIVCIYNDPQCVASYGSLIRKLYSGHSSFVNLGILHEYFDDCPKGAKQKCVPLIGNYRLEIDPNRLDEDFEIVIASNSRLNEVIAWKAPIERVIALLNAPYSDLSTWYLAILMLLKKRLPAGYERSIIQRNLWSIYYGASQFMKHQIVKSIDTDRKISLFGDRGWETLAPSFYSGILNQAQLREMMIGSKRLLVLMNSGFSYLDHNGPIYDAIQTNTPWINLPTIAKTSTFISLEALEYRCNTSFNLLLDNANTHYNNRAVQSSIKELNLIYRSGIQSVLDLICEPENLKANAEAHSEASTTYGQSYNDHKKLINEEVEAYSTLNIQSLNTTLDYISSLQVR